MRRSLQSAVAARRPTGRTARLDLAISHAAVRCALLGAAILVAISGGFGVGAAGSLAHAQPPHVTGVAAAGSLARARQPLAVWQPESPAHRPSDPGTSAYEVALPGFSPAAPTSIPPHPGRPAAGDPVLGVNADLTRYDAEGLERVVGLLADAGVEAVRVPVRWAEMEPERGLRDWSALDSVMTALGERGVHAVVAIGTSPAWSRSDPTPEPHLWLCEDESVTGDQHAASAPPTDPGDLARFAASVARRYGGGLWAVEVWPEPNLLPNWRATGPDPEDYGAMLEHVSEAVRAEDTGVLLVSGAIAPTTDIGVCYLSDVVFLDRLARSGALGAVDAVGIEPFGLAEGPADGVADRETLNFSRTAVLGEVLNRHSVEVPIWASAWGWVGLPDDWAGEESPWGQHDPGTAAEWTRQGYARARAEWPWMGAMFVWLLQPEASREDPVWGFTLLDASGKGTETWGAVADLAAGRVPAWSAAPAAKDDRGRPGPATLVAALAVAGAVGVALAWVFRHRARRRLALLLAHVSSMSPWLLVTVFVISALTAVVAPWPASLVAVPLMIIIASADARIAFAAVTAATPFFYRMAMNIGPRPFGPVEVLLFVALCGQMLSWYAGGWSDGRAGGAGRTDDAGRDGLSHSVLRVARALRPLDWLAMAVVAWAVLTPFWAEHPAPAWREWRTVIAEPVVFYFLLRAAADRRRAALAAVDGLVLGGVAAALWALAGVGLFSAGVGAAAVAAEGVVRANGPYSSPNNLALFLGRLIPVVAAFMLWGRDRRRRLYAAASVPIALALLATFSRSAFVIGLPVTAIYLVAVVVHEHGRLTVRPFAIAAAAVFAAAAALLPFASTTRVRGTFDIQPGSTLFIRLRLWESALDMARDHPILGVGLDNFLYLYRDRYVQRDAVQERFLNHPHNAVLDWWTRLGLPGLMFFSLLVVGNVLTGVRAIRRSSGGVLALAAGALGMQVYALAHGSVDNVFFLVDLAIVWWVAQSALLATVDGD